MLVPPPPHVQHHESQAAPQKIQLEERSEAEHYAHPKEEEYNERSPASLELTFLEQPTIPHQKVTMEQKIQTKSPKVAKRRHQPPHLTLQDQLRIKVEGKARSGPRSSKTS